MYEYIPPKLDLSDAALANKYWPKGGQKLFRDDGHWTEVALLDGAKTWFGYVYSFRSAATMLYEAAFARGGIPGDKDVVFIPFAFLWRHYAELALKAGIIDQSRYLGESVDLTALCDTHSLKVLWDEFQPLDERALPDESSKDRKFAGKTISQLQQVDPKSMHFRYPVNKDGKPHLKGTARVAMQNFHEQMLGFASWIEAGLDKLDDLQDLNLDYEQWISDQADYG